MTLTPLTQRRLANFRANRRGYWSMMVFAVLFIYSGAKERLTRQEPPKPAETKAPADPMKAFLGELDAPVKDGKAFKEAAGQPGLHETGLREGEDDHLPGGGGRQQRIEPPEQGGQDHEEGSEEEQGRQPEGGQGKGGASLRGKSEPSGTGLPGHGFPQS